MVVPGNPQSIHDAVHINVDGEVGILLTKRREDSCHVNHIIDFVLVAEFSIAVGVSDIKALKLAREFELLVALV